MTVAWFHSLPRGWISRRIKTFSPVMRGASPRPIDDPIYFDDDGEYAWVRISDVTASNGSLTSTTQRLSTLGASKSVKLDRGRLFLSIAGSVGKPCITDIKACIHDGFVYFPYLPVESQKFLYWVFESRECFSGLGKLGTQLNLNTETVGNIAIPFPDLATQRQIADFLDRETARIDLLIEKKQRLVALLGERRTIELEKLLFESGFQIRKLRREARVISKGTTPSTIGAEMVDDGVRFLKAENVTWNGVSTSPENFISEETHRALKRSSLQPGDVLVVIAGATTGKTAVMPAELAPANTNQAVSFVRLREPRYADIVCAAIGCSRVQRDILLTSVQSAQPNLSMEDLGNLMLPFPNEAEISSVLEQVIAANSRSAALIAATETSIDRLKEYRSALITAAVTGQIDVATYAKSGTPERRLDAIQEEMGA